MQSYIRAVYASTADRGHRCPCSTVRDIRQYTNELIKKRHPELSPKKLLEATNNTIINAGYEFQEKYTNATWKAATVKVEKERIKRFISNALDRLMLTPDTYETFKKNLAASSTPKKTTKPLILPTPKNDTAKDVADGKAISQKLVQTEGINAEDQYKTPDRKIKPKVASESKFFVGMIDYKDGKVVITSPDTPSLPPSKLHLESSIYDSALDEAESPFNMGVNSYDNFSTADEDYLLEKEFAYAPSEPHEDNFYDSIELISETPKLNPSLPRRIKKLEQHIMELNSSLLESSIKHSQRKRADSLSSLHQLFDKMVSVTPTPPMRKRANSLKNSSLTQSPKTPTVAQHYLTPRICKKETKQMFDGNCRNLLETFKQGARDIKEIYIEQESCMNNSINKLRIDSMFPRLPIKKTPCVIKQSEVNYKKRWDSLNLDYTEMMASTTVLKEHDLMVKIARKRVKSLNLESTENQENITDRLLSEPDGVINHNLDEHKKNAVEKMALKFSTISRMHQIDNKIEELSMRIQQMKLNLIKHAR